MNGIEPTKTNQRYSMHELLLTRSLLLEHTRDRHAMPEDVLRNSRNYSCVTHWEELLSVAINTKVERLMAVACIRRPDGYSSMLNNHDSKEYIRFFIDWGRGQGYEDMGLAEIDVSDVPLGRAGEYLPYHQLVAVRFDADRYWESILDGIQPKACAVLSWNQVPPTHITFRPVFGNVIESRIRIESIRDFMALYDQRPM